jgi:hypothetical protein
MLQPRPNAVKQRIDPSSSVHSADPLVARLVVATITR